MADITVNLPQFLAEIISRSPSSTPPQDHFQKHAREFGIIQPPHTEASARAAYESLIVRALTRGDSQALLLRDGRLAVLAEVPHDTDRRRMIPICIYVNNSDGHLHGTAHVLERQGRPLSLERAYQLIQTREGGTPVPRIPGHNRLSIFQRLTTTQFNALFNRVLEPHILRGYGASILGSGGEFSRLRPVIDGSPGAVARFSSDARPPPGVRPGSSAGRPSANSIIPFFVASAAGIYALLRGATPAEAAAAMGRALADQAVPGAGEDFSGLQEGHALQRALAGATTVTGAWATFGAAFERILQTLGPTGLASFVGRGAPIAGAVVGALHGLYETVRHAMNGQGGQAVGAFLGGAVRTFCGLLGIAGLAYGEAGYESVRQGMGRLGDVLGRNWWISPSIPVAVGDALNSLATTSTTDIEALLAAASSSPDNTLLGPRAMLGTPRPGRSVTLAEFERMARLPRSTLGPDPGALAGPPEPAPLLPVVRMSHSGQYMSLIPETAEQRLARIRATLQTTGAAADGTTPEPVQAAVVTTLPDLPSEPRL